jgi:hypothetical protein
MMTPMHPGHEMTFNQRSNRSNRPCGVRLTTVVRQSRPSPLLLLLGWLPLRTCSVVGQVDGNLRLSTFADSDFDEQTAANGRTGGLDGVSARNLGRESGVPSAGYRHSRHAWCAQTGAT